ANSGRCLLVEEASTADNVPIVQGSVSWHDQCAAEHERWRWVGGYEGPDGEGFKIVNLHSGKCLEPWEEAVDEPGTRLVQAPCRDADDDSQVWSRIQFTTDSGWNYYWAIRNKRSDLCMDNQDATKAGELLVQETCATDGSQTQQFRTDE
ncbi:MAG: RICIN domain-containing protein, partial [Stackebrandtia sp.]